MNTLTHLAAATTQAPNLPGGTGAIGGTVTAGVIAAAWLIAKWKKEITGDTRRYVIVAIVMTACLTYGTGVLAQMLGATASTAGTITNTVTGTVTGQ